MFVTNLEIRNLLQRLKAVSGICIIDIFMTISYTTTYVKILSICDFNSSNIYIRLDMKSISKKLNNFILSKVDS